MNNMYEYIKVNINEEFKEILDNLLIIQNNNYYIEKIHNINIIVKMFMKNKSIEYNEEILLDIADYTNKRLQLFQKCLKIFGISVIRKTCTRLLK